MKKYRLELDVNKHPVLVMEEEYEYKETIINSPAKAVDLVNKLFRLKYMAEEYLYMLALDTKGEVIGILNISHGGVNYAECNPRNIFIRALIIGAVNIILIHNHPSGSCEPSKEDIKSARRLKEAADLLSIGLHDFIIVAGNEYYSICEAKIL